MENIATTEDFAPPIDDATEVDPFGGYQPPEEETHEPQSYTPPQPPPVAPNYNPQDYDDTPAWVEYVPDVETYTKNIIAEVGNRFQQTLADERLYSRVESAEARAIEVHNGKDGLPSYSELVDGIAIPLMRQRQDLRQLVLAQSDPASAAYLIGFCCRYPHLVPQVIARNGRLDASIFRSTNFRATVGQSSGRRQPSGRLTAAEINAMSPLDFETQVLDPFKMSSEGE